MDFPKEYPKILAVNAVVLSKEGKVLLHRREQDPDKGKWELFGTYVRPQEQLTDAVKRRLLEDAGISSVTSIEFTGRYYDQPGRHVGSYCIPLIFKAVVEASSVTNTAECSWFSKEEAVAFELALDNSRVLRDMLAS